MMSVNGASSPVDGSSGIEAAAATPDESAEGWLARQIQIGKVTGTATRPAP